jgi:photosystem II stability/assembly factor-like uncharacterized protein
MAPNTLNGWVVRSDTIRYVLHTPDCGLTWITQGFLSVYSRYFYDVFFLNEQKGWIGTNQGFIYYTANRGDSWQIQYMGLAKNIFRVDFLDDSCGWVACSNAMLGRTIHGGLNYSWDQIFLPYPPYDIDTVDIWGISFVNRFKGWFCSGRYLEYIESLPGQGDTWFRKGQGYIAVSNDSGLNWQLLLRDTINDFYDIKMLDSLNGFVIGGNDRTMSAVIMKTSNGGNAWQPVTIPTQAKYLRSLKFVGNHAWAVGHRGTILHSNNDGNTWQMQTSNVNTTLYDVDFSDTLHGLVAGDSYVLYTYNSGNTWNIAAVGIEEESSTLNAIHSILEVYPNPSKALTAIRYSLRAESKVSLQLFDISGRLVKTLVNESKNSGNYSVIWNRTDDNNRKVGEGVYFCILKTSGGFIKQKILMVK